MATPNAWPVRDRASGGTRGYLPPLAVLGALGVLVAACASTPASTTASGDQDWPVYGGNPGGDRYSGLDQIDAGNVAGLREVWRYETEGARLQTSPLMIEGILYGVTPGQGVFALD